ncbi:hypothetical protein [Candidatus Vampirococcus lugosii]|uniref:VWFA domain-containing protein n=1 Tax=Candidatus Vampirococcus lugosii TaxID=2789015 RepID=A0ABS5QJP3_9BACT|nr:hypothetical protein [Candidatus Vampirococcus lugosii]MBS8121496.1 hypothetical protein [Candidatus Vampirococcus lugosii]
MQKYYKIILIIKTIFLLISGVLFFVLGLTQNSGELYGGKNNIIFLVDLSLDNEQLDDDRDFILNYVNKINNGQKVGLIIYEDGSNYEIPATNDLQTYKEYIYALSVGGVSIPSNKDYEYIGIDNALNNFNLNSKESDIGVILGGNVLSINQDVLNSIKSKNQKIHYVSDIQVSNDLNGKYFKYGEYSMLFEQKVGLQIDSEKKDLLKFIARFTGILGI